MPARFMRTRVTRPAHLRLCTMGRFATYLAMKTKHGDRGQLAGGTLSGVLWTLLLCGVLAVAFFHFGPRPTPDLVVAHESPATPAPTPAPIPTPPEAVPAAAPALVVMPAVPANPAPLEIDAVVVTPSLWPAQVALVRAWPFSIVIGGRPAGQATAPAGALLRVLRVGAQQIEVEFQGARHLVPVEATDLMARAETAFRKNGLAPTATDPALTTSTAVAAIPEETAAPADGSPVALSRSVFLDGVESVGDSKTTNHWRTYSGSYSKTKTSSRDLTITVRNMSSSPGQFSIEWYFVGKPVNGTSRFLYDKGERQVTLAPSAFDKFVVESKELSSRNVRDNGYYYYYYGYSYKSGDRPDGWIIRAKVGDQVIRTKTSNAQLEQLVKNEEAFARFVEKQK